MAKSSLLRNVLQVLLVATGTAAVAGVVAWPRVTVAEPGDPATAQAERGTKLGDVLAEGKLFRDTTTNAWCVKLHAKNRGKTSAFVGVRLGVLREVNDPRNRAEPSPTTVWREDTTLRLAPDEESDATFPLPEAAALRLTKDADRPAGPWYARPMGPGGGHVTVSHDVVLLRIPAASVKAS